MQVWLVQSHLPRPDIPQCSKHACQDERPQDHLFPASHPHSLGRCLKGAQRGRLWWRGTGEARSTPITSSWGELKQPHPVNDKGSHQVQGMLDVACPLLGQVTLAMHTLPWFLFHSPISQCGPDHRNKTRLIESVTQGHTPFGNSQATRGGGVPRVTGEAHYRERRAVRKEATTAESSLSAWSAVSLQVSLISSQPLSPGLP